MPMSTISAVASSTRGTCTNPPPATRMRATNPATNGTAPHAPPLSFMRSAPLDLSTVERRGQPTAVPEPVLKKSRPHGLQDAPTYWPTEEEWLDPFEFIGKIAPEAMQYGLCKIIPPDCWNPDFAIDTEKFHFRTRKQELNSVEGSTSPPSHPSSSSGPGEQEEPSSQEDAGTRANLAYLDGLSKFHKQHGGNNLHRLPYVDKKPLDLYRLKKAVEVRGGFESVCKQKKWAEIGRDLGYSGKIMSSLSTSLKNSFQKWLCPYEEYLRLARPGVHQQIEAEYGGPLGTPSPAPTPGGKRPAINTTPAAAARDSPARTATDALQVSLNGGGSGSKEANGDVAMTDAPPPSSSGFTAVNSGGFTALGGFTAVNSGFMSVNRQAAAAAATAASAAEADAVAATPSKQSAPANISTNTPEYKPSPLGPAPLKRQLSCDGPDVASKDGGDDGGSRRSKRLKKENVPTVAGSHMTLFRATGPRMPRDEGATPGEKCENCGKGNENATLTTCASCDNSYHATCLDPSLHRSAATRSDYDWSCPRCLVGDGRFGFEDGGLYSLRAFQQKAAQFKQAYFEKKMPTDPALGCVRPVTEEDVENEFWRLVGDIEETVEVEYGADIHCTTHGSGFPTAEKDPRSRYSTDPWNLNILPLHGDSLFRHIKSDISGMTVPWVYVGMMFSTFCWHNEDHYSYSANYQHFGATKTWYGIPAEDAEKFEAAMREAVPELFETQPDLLFQLVTLLTPEHLKKAGVRVYAADQRAGQFVITFPQAYHAGFNHGFNFNEAVNFAPRDWEPFGLAGVERLQLFRRQPCFSHDELLWTAAELGAVSISMAKWLAPALSKVSRREVRQRDDFVAKHLEAAAPHKCPLVDQAESGGEGAACRLSVIIDDGDVPEEEYQCAQCKAFSFLSRFRCQASGKVLCLLHAGQHACCDAAEPLRYGGDGAHVLIYRKSDAEIEAANRRVRDRARMPEAWEEKYDRLLDEESLPSLRVLRSLLHEGEKIPFELPSLSVLREFVDRCNEWVEEATVYTVRKQQNRRKSEKTLGAAAATAAAAAAAAGGREQQQDGRNVENMRRLLADAEQIGFDCPEIQQLRERTVAIEDYEHRVQAALETVPTVDVIEDLLREGREFNVDLLQVDSLAHRLSQMRWNDDAREKRTMFLTMEEVQALVDEGQRLDIVPYNDHLKFFEDQMTNGKQWEKKAREIMAAEVVHHPQLETLSNQVRTQRLPVSKETYDAVDHILSKHREAARQVLDILDRTKDLDYRRRPKYADVAALMKKLEDMSSKPTGMSDLEREQRRHEDWMRRGKKLFGKTNAPLHILKSHMEYVLEKNTECFDVITDKPRLPAEPCSREPSPDSKREVFCICRRTEAGLMIECEVCHEWYHSRCLKIARGKIKEEDKYTCPICDWRVKIPRDAARPKLEELQDWHEEIPSLPFQPEEEEVLDAIIDNALRFRDHLTDCFSSLDATRNESETQRFYLRKIEGAEILLSYETNFFRQELHRWSPVAPEPPPVQDQSLSTRKPRPTKLQKLMAQYNATNLEDLPEDVRAKAHSLRRKQINNELSAAAAARMAAVTAAASGVTSPVYNTGYFQPPLQGSSSSQRTLSIGAHSMHSTSPSESGGEAGPPAPSQSMTMPLLLHQTPTMMQTSRLVDSSGGALSVGDRLSHGDEDGPNPDMDDDRRRALEIFSHTEDGRRRAVKIFGANVWGGGSGGNDMRLQSAGSGAGTATGHDDEGDVDKMFTDLTNQEDEDEGGGGSSRRPAERKSEGEAAAAAA